MAHPFESGNPGRKYPFQHMKIDDNSILNNIEGRSSCMKCGKSRKFFCYTCYLPISDLCGKLPRIDLPVKIDIIKHKNEIDGKSSAAHASILAPNDVKIYTYPDIPNYESEEGVILIFPGTNSITINQLFNRNIKIIKKENFGLPKGFNMGTLLRVRVEEETITNESIENENKCTVKKYTKENLPIKKAVFIDSTWNQSRGIYKDERICNMKSVILQNRISQFWRHQRGSPRWYLATIEAIHQFLLEIHVNAWGLNSNYKGLDNLDICQKFYETIEMFDYEDDMNSISPYNGQYDNLLFFFSYMYDLIHFYYDHNELKSYRRPI